MWLHHQGDEALEMEGDNLHELVAFLALPGNPSYIGGKEENS